MQLSDKSETELPVLFLSLMQRWDGGVVAIPMFRPANQPPAESEILARAHKMQGEKISTKPAIIGPFPLPTEIQDACLGFTQASEILRKIHSDGNIVAPDVAELLGNLFGSSDEAPEKTDDFAPGP
jgi:hypothetical protein